MSTIDPYLYLLVIRSYNPIYLRTYVIMFETPHVFGVMHSRGLCE